MLPATLPIAVLDTNVVLDWLLFDDPAAAPLAAAIEGRRVRWLATESMRAELAHVLAYPTLGARAPGRPDALQVWDALAAAAPAAPAHALRCSDPADQGFIDLALEARASWLVTRDGALLRLAKRAARAGTHILRPADWPGTTA